jgi:hypothetical protein
MAIGGFGFQSLGAYGAGAVSGGAGAYGVTDATGGATAAEAALASAQDKTFADVLQKAYDEGDKEKLKEVCTQFESIMLSMMYKGMKATVPESSLVEESRAQEIFDDMLDEEVSGAGRGRGRGRLSGGDGCRGGCSGGAGIRNRRWRSAGVKGSGGTGMNRLC